ncbi:MAG: efflux RND transporter periplasmic adaptor subunit [Thermoanaerobaculia bacterium]
MTDEERIEEEATGEARVTARRRWRRWKWLSLAGGTVLAAGLVVFALSMGADGASGAGEQEAEAAEDGEAKDGEDEKAPVPVEVVSLERGEVSSYISATANLVAERDVTVVSEAEGRVTALNVEEGDHVGAGDVLAVLDSEDEQIATRKAEVLRDKARVAYERAADLLQQQLVSQQEHDQLQADLEVAEQELIDARLRLRRTSFRAPFSGRVTSRRIQVGQHIRPGDQLFQITDFDPLIAVIHLPETDVLALTPGREVRLALNADPRVRFAGRIRQISPVVDTATGTVKLTIEAQEPPEGVRPGGFVAVNIVRESRPRSLLLPKRAVVRELQASHVFVAQKDVAKRRRVELGIEEGEWVEALSGVKAGERVVVAGQGGLKEGAAIRILEPGDDEAGGQG